MIVVSLRYESVVAMKRRHDWLGAETERADHESMMDGGRKALATVDSKPIFTPRTGALQDATTTRVVKTSKGRILRIRNPKKYAASIDKGSKGHVIAQRRKPFLVFRYRGQWMRKKWIWHPGTRAYRFLENAQKQAGNRYERAMRMRMSRIASRFSR